MSEMIKIGVANDTEKNMSLEELSKWVPTNIHMFGDTAYFKHDKVYYSMTINDFNKLYKKNGNN